MPTQKHTDYKRAFNEKNYDRLAITIPKGQKQAVEAHAKTKGESINGLVNGLLRADMGLTEDEWKKDSSPTE
ncbi:MAG: antitoxin [Candidatus Limiplasma sp.]|nr:antitoxin [Candidatus Limiplasma sp.]